jgi:hypothetical protein
MAFMGFHEKTPGTRTSPELLCVGCNYLPPVEPAAPPVVPAPTPEVPVPIPVPLVLLLLGLPTPLDVPGVPMPLLGDVELLGVLLGEVLDGELMSGVPGDDGSPGVEGLPKPLLEPLELLPGAPVALTPKCELICWLHEVSMLGQVLAENVGALWSFDWSTLSVN